VVLKSMHFPVGAAQEEEAWFLSFVIKCQRAVVLDSFGSKNARAVPFGGPEFSGKMLTLPVNVPIFQDTRIEMYRHKNDKNRSRKLIWFAIPQTVLNQSQ
jgi:hypothetical protein